MRYLSAFLILLCINYQASGQVQFNSLQDLLEYADKNSPAARQAELQPYIAKQDINIQASGLYPKVNAFASGDYYPIIATQVIPAEVLGGPKGTYLKAQFGLPYVFMTGLEFSMPVVNLEKWSQLAKSRALYRQTIWGSRLAMENLHLQLVQAYYQYLVLKEVSRLNDENLVISGELMRIMDERRLNGIVNPSDYNRSRNLQLDVRSAVINYQESLQQALNNIQALLNISPEDSLVITDSMTQFDWTLLTSVHDIAGRPAWQEVTARIEVASTALKESRRAALPRLNLNGRYAYNMQTKLESGSNNVEFDVSNISLRLDVPLFQGNFYRSLRRKNSLALQSAYLERERLAGQLTLQHQDWLNQYQSAYSKHSVLKEKISSASDNLRIARLSIQEEVMEFDEFNNIFVEYNRARMEYIQNLADGVLYYLLSTQNL